MAFFDFYPFLASTKTETTDFSLLSVGNFAPLVFGMILLGRRNVQCLKFFFFPF